MLSISRELLRDLILSAYESGWSGILEFKEEYADQVIQHFEKETVVQTGSSTLTVGVDPSYSISPDLSFGAMNPTFIPGYYSTLTQTSPAETVWVNNPGQDAF